MAAPSGRGEAPKLEFDWEEAIFRAVRGLVRRVRPSSTPPESPACVRLADEADRLRTLARVISGRDYRVRPSRSVGGTRGLDILLPERVDLADSAALNRLVYVVRVVLAAGLKDAIPDPEPAGDPVLDWLRRRATAVERLREEFPRFGEMHDAVAALELATRPDPDRLAGRARWEEVARQAALRGVTPWRDPILAAELRRARVRRGSESAELLVWGAPIAFERTLDSHAAADEAPEAIDGTEDEAGAVDDLRVLVLNEEDAKEMPVHVFEKVEMLEEWQGGVKRMDGADDLDDHLEALDELDLKDLVRGGERARALLRADIALDVDIPDVARIAPHERGIAYDEWDGRRRRYRPGWSTVYPTALAATDSAWARDALGRRRRLVEDLVNRLTCHRQQLRPASRQLDGEDVDIDMLVGELASTRAGHGGDQRLYVRRSRQARDVATLVLLDISLSSDSWVDDRRVLDVSREAVLVLGEVASRLGDRMRVMAFASHTRNQVRAFDVLGWDEPWEKGRARLGALRPQGYTRIGPALRHATADLRATDARERLILLVSDGKPTDYDRYEGRYGVADIRQAVREAERDGVHVHALAIESTARDYLPALMGPGAWHLLPRPEQLVEVLTTIYGRLSS